MCQDLLPLDNRQAFQSKARLLFPETVKFGRVSLVPAACLHPAVPWFSILNPSNNIVVKIAKYLRCPFVLSFLLLLDSWNICTVLVLVRWFYFCILWSRTKCTFFFLVPIKNKSKNESLPWACASTDIPTIQQLHSVFLRFRDK